MNRVNREVGGFETNRKVRANERIDLLPSTEGYFRVAGNERSELDSFKVRLSIRSALVQRGA